MARRKNMKSPAVALSLPAPVASSDPVARDPPVPQQSQTTEEILRELSPYEIEAAWILIGMKCDTVPPAASSRSNLMEQVLDQEGDASTRSASTTIAGEEQSQPASDDGSLTAGNESEVTNGCGEKLEDVEEKARDKPYDEVGAVTDENVDCQNVESEDAVAKACSPCKSLSTHAKRPRDDDEDGNEDEDYDEDSNDDGDGEDDEYIPPSGRTRAKTQLQAETQSRSPKRQSSCAPKSKRPRLEECMGSIKYTMPSTPEDISSWITENPVPEGLVLPIGENPRQCPKCLVIVLARERGSLKADVARHQRICKTEFRRFSCQVPNCGHKDDQRSNMHAHIRNNHFGKDLVSSRYRCTACGYMHLKAAPFFKHECFVDQEKNKHAT